MTAAPPLEVVAAVIEDRGLFLACRRREGKAEAGKWEFPGGKVEPGESAAEALVREIREELGVEIRVTGHLTTDDSPAGAPVIRLVCLVAELDGERPTTSTDHDALEWVSRKDLAALDWAAADQAAVRMLSSGDPPPTASATPHGS